MRIGCVLICLAILLPSKVEAGPMVMVMRGPVPVVVRGDYYDSTCYSVDPITLTPITTPSSCIQTSKEIRYFTLAKDPRFAAVGAFVHGITTALASGVNPRFCSGTVIGPYTVLTAAHCFYDPPDIDYTPVTGGLQRQLEGISFVLGPDTLHPTERMRVFSVIIAPGFNPSTLENDWALVQVYDDTTFLGAATPGVQLYTAGTETDGLSFPIFVGYGLAGYGSQPDCGGVIGPDAGDSGYGPCTAPLKPSPFLGVNDGFKRAFLVGDFKFGTIPSSGSTNNFDVDTFASPVYLSTSLLRPSNFLEGHPAPGDSGGGFFYPQGGTWALAGIASWISATLPNTYNLALPPTVTGDSAAGYTRIAPIESSITPLEFTTGPAVHWPIASSSGPSTAVVALSAAPTVISAYVVTDCGSAPITIGLDLAASDPTVSISLSIESEVLASYSGLAPIATAETLTFTPSTTLPSCTPPITGLVPLSLDASLQITINGPSGAVVELSGLSIPGLANADFSNGTVGFDVTGASSVTTKPNPTSGLVVPNVVGLTEAAATSAITGAGLVLGTVTQQSSSTVAIGNVISESPTAGTAVNGGSRVNLTVSAYATAGNCDGAPGHQILPPIATDGSSVFQLGSTVPAKFRVCNAKGQSIGTPGVVSSFLLVQAGGTTVNEPVTTTTPHTTFRWDQTNQQWIFNITTEGMQAGITYVYQIMLNDNSSITFQFGLK